MTVLATVVDVSFPLISLSGSLFLLVGEDAKCTATACKLLRFACLPSGSVVSAADTSKSSSLLLLFLRSVPSFTSLDGSGSIRSMAGPALSMAALAVVIIVLASRLCLLECSFAASRALSLMEDLLPQKLPPPSCNNSCSLSEATTDIAPSSFALDLVMAAVESVPPLAGPCSLLRQSATACLLSVPETCTIS